MTHESDTNEEEIVNALLNHLNNLRVSKQEFDNTNQIIAELMRPNDTGFNKTVSTGAREDQEIFDTTANRANMDLASILQSQLTPPGEKWAVLKDSDKELDKIEEVKKFYEDLSDEFYNVTRDSESNFYQKNHEFFLDYPVFGTGAMFVSEDEDDNIVFELRKLQEIFCDQNSKGTVDILYREFEFTMRQAVQEFGEENLGEEVKGKLMKNPSDKTKFTHHLLPMRDYMRITGENKPFSNTAYKSVYISIEDKKIVREGFFNEKPFAVARWSKRIGEVYGFGAAWDVLSDIEVLNILSMLELEGLELIIRPMLLAADEGVIGNVDWTPSGVTYGAISEDGKRLLDQVDLGFDVSKAFIAKEQRIKNIEAAFFVDKFRERDGVQPLTATEALLDEEKRLALLSPQTKRIEDEYLTPIIRRTVAIILRQGRIEIPEILREQDLNYEVNYISPLSFTTRRAELGRYTKFIQNAGPFLTAVPSTLENVDADSIVRNIAIKSGIPRDELIDKDTVKANRETRAKAQQQQEQLANIESGASAVKNLAQAGIINE